MTEVQLRQKIADIMVGWLGYSEKNGKHKEIIDIYNAHKPLARGYAVQYGDEWCATAVSAAFIEAGLTDIAPTECSCNSMIELYKALGRWQEADGYTPAVGDIIMYDWQDIGAGENIGAADHVGIVEKVGDKTLTIIEGNKGEAVSRRTMTVDGRYIRGYCLPDYASKASSELVKDWAEEAKNWAVKNGLIAGTGEGADGKPDYAWGDAPTRAQLVTILYRFAKLIGKA